MKKGGYDLDNEQSVFSFELNESLNFEKGHEVSEIKGVSLDPDISIQSFDEYISIRGVVELRGEYEKVALLDDDPNSPSIEDYHQTKRYIEEVIELDDDVFEFSHRFPVEISVPTYRVNNLDDVTVRIASFDYELPDPGQFNLMSTIEIHGINNEDIQETDLKEEQGTFEQESVQEEKFDKTFEFEIKKREDHEKTTEDLDLLVEPTTEVANRQEVDQEETSDEDDADQDDENNESERPLWKKEYSQTIAEFFEKTASKESISSPSPSFDSHPSMDVSASFESDDSVDVMESSSSQEGTHFRYLTGMFRDEEENYTKMRLCIVQENDTLESIAERYGTTSMHIASQNKLIDNSISHGELLYIPFKKKK